MRIAFVCLALYLPAVLSAQPIAWTSLDGPYDGGGGKLIGTPEGVLFRGGGGLLLRSDDGGATWAPTAYPGDGVRGLDFGPDGELLVGSTDGAYRSTDGGATWEALGPAGEEVQRIGALTSGQLFARVGNASSCTLLRSDDEGATWTPVPDIEAPYGCTDFLVAPDDALLLITQDAGPDGEGGRSIYRTLNGGAVWHRREFPSTGIARFVVGQYGGVFAVAFARRGGFFTPPLDSGLFSYSPGGIWTELSDGAASTAGTRPDASVVIGLMTGVPAEGLSAPSPQAIVTGPDGALVVSTRSSGLYRRAPDAAWAQVDGFGKGASRLAFDPSGQLHAANRAAILHLDGEAWQPTPWARDEADGFVFRAGDPAAEDTLLVASEWGGLWNATTDERLAVVEDCQYLTCLAPALAQTPSGALFASMGGIDGGDYCGDEAAGVFRSLDGGATWEESLPDVANVCHLAVGPGDVVAAGAGNCGCLFGGSGVYLSADNGERWEAVAEGFPTADVTALTIGSAGEVIAGAYDHGVFRLGGEGTWEALGLADRSIYALAVNAEGQVMAGTEQGAFIYDGVSWRAAGLAGDQVNALLIDAEGFGYAATASGAYRSAQPVIVASEAPPVRAVSTLSAGYPNPFRERATLVLTLPAPEDLTVTVYDVLGKQVAVLHTGPLSAGEHRFVLDGQSLPAGTYLVRATGGAIDIVRRVVLAY